MPYNCTPCQQLLSTGRRHTNLQTISHINHSELVKCLTCATFYLHEHEQWEALSACSDNLSSPTTKQPPLYCKTELS